MSAKTITINPITRLEGHGKIEIFLNREGKVENAYLARALKEVQKIAMEVIE